MSLIEQSSKPSTARFDQPAEIRLPARIVTIADKKEIALGRQIVRRLGLIEIRARLHRMFPRYTRQEIRQLAVELNHNAWDGRDRDALERARGKKS